MPFERIIPHPFTAGGVQAYAPLSSGVYGISNARQWIYIGETGNIQSALLTHLRQAGGPLMQYQPAGFVYEVCDQNNRAQRQGRLIQEYDPACNGHLSR